MSREEVLQGLQDVVALISEAGEVDSNKIRGLASGARHEHPDLTNADSEWLEA
ncbi:unnamed protein product, partial [marine sediment metagenome]